MPNYCVIEVENGLTPVEIESGQKPEDAAVVHGGVLVDPGPYATPVEANDAITSLQLEEDDERY